MAWNLLFTSDIGLASLIGILFIIGLGVWFARFYSRKMQEEEAQIKAGKSDRKP